MTALASLRHPAARRRWLTVLALLVALAPLAGAWHRVAHAVGGQPLGHAMVVGHATGVAAPATRQTDAAAAHAFGHAAGAPECLLYDAALTGQAPAPAVPALALPPAVPCAPVMLPPAAPALALGWRLPARGPPRA